MDQQQDYSTSSMIALLPVDGSWSKSKLPHLTLVYAGEVGADLEPTDFNRLAKDASSLAMMNRAITLDASGVELFGKDDEKVDVLTFKLTPELSAMRHFVEGWNQSEYTEFRPHVTMGPPGSHVLADFIPRQVTFDRVYVCFGMDDLTFRMNRG